MGKRSMLDYCKTVLTKLSFNKALFRKEFEKSRKWLSGPEVDDLKTWAEKNFHPSFFKRSA